MEAASVSSDALQLAWVETTATDLTGHGWKLHLTDFSTGDDSLVAVDPRQNIESDRLNAHIPLTSLSSARLLYTILVPGTSGPNLELRLRTNPKQTTVIARLDAAGRLVKVLPRHFVHTRENSCPLIQLRRHL